MGKAIEIRPQAGPQETACASPADILIFGGAAGGGKSYYLLLEPLRHINNPRFGAVIFRQTYPQIRNEGGLWDESNALYGQLNTVAIETRLEHTFPSGATVSFAHMQHDQDTENWRGAQIPLLCWDELTQFSSRQFWFMLSRNRSTCGVRPYVRATCNPDSESWVAELIAWWIDQETGYPIQARSGVIRWFVRDRDEMHWFDDRASAVEFAKTLIPDEVEGDAREVLLQNAQERPKSFTFVAANVEDNTALMRNDPGYMANLMALDVVERERLLRGNWKIRPAAGMIFPRDKWKRAGALPPGEYTFCRFWDKAGTEGGAGARTAGVLMAMRVDWLSDEKTKRMLRMPHFYVLGCDCGRWSDFDVEDRMLSNAEKDRQRWGYVEIGMEQEPGSGGKFAAKFSIRSLSGYPVFAVTASGSKASRWRPLAVQQQAGNVTVITSDDWDWRGFEAELDALSGDEIMDTRKLKDRADAAAGAFNRLALSNKVQFGGMFVVNVASPMQSDIDALRNEDPSDRFQREKRELIASMAASIDAENGGD